MPRIKTGWKPTISQAYLTLVDRLEAELRQNTEFGQPIIEEEQFPESGARRVNVIWDEFVDVPDDQRTLIVLAAFERAEGKSYSDQIALVSGLTVPEAHLAGLMPYQVHALVRKSDPVTLEQCIEEMKKEGASLLFDKKVPRLYFTSEEQAQAAVERLKSRLPQSDDIWAVSQDTVPREPSWEE